MKDKSTFIGLGFFDVLLIVFVVLKLTKVIDWPWIWVLSPLWGAFIIVGILVGIAAIIMHWVDK